MVKGTVDPETIGHQFIAGNYIHTLLYLGEFRVDSTHTCMFFRSGRKLENSEETHMYTNSGSNQEPWNYEVAMLLNTLLCCVLFPGYENSGTY